MKFSARSTVDLELQVLDRMEPAFEWTAVDTTTDVPYQRVIFFSGDRLWEPVYRSDSPNGRCYPVPVDTFLAETSAGVPHPRTALPVHGADVLPSAPTALPTREELLASLRVVRGDMGDIVADRYVRAMGFYAALGGQLYRATQEPVYRVLSERQGLVISICRGSKDFAGKPDTFPATQLQQALAYATSLAQRGDGCQPLPIIPGSVISVFASQASLTDIGRS